METRLAEHRALGLPTTAEQAQALIALYNGTLLTLLVAPPGTVTPAATLGLARCLVTGCCQLGVVRPMKLDPAAVQARREHARRTRQRVEVRREESGNASVAGREMDTADALAAKAHIHALALRLRRAGVPGTLDQLRLLVFADLTVGRDPLACLARTSVDGTAASSPGAAGPGHPPAGVPPRPDSQNRPAGSPPPPDTRNRPTGSLGPDGSGSPYGGFSCREDDNELNGDPDPAVRVSPVDPPDPAVRVSPLDPMPAMINLVVHAGTLFGWDTAPSEAGEWGLLDADETRAIVAAASCHPATRWCLTLLGCDGTAIAHGCSAGRHPWMPGKQDGEPPGWRTPGPALLSPRNSRRGKRPASRRAARAVARPWPGSRG